MKHLKILTSQKCLFQIVCGIGDADEDFHGDYKEKSQYNEISQHHLERKFLKEWDEFNPLNRIAGKLPELCSPS